MFYVDPEGLMLAIKIFIGFGALLYVLIEIADS
jgi:hypothetical protein